MTETNGHANGWIATPEDLLGDGARRFDVAEAYGRRLRLRSLTRKEMRRIEDTLYTADGARDLERWERLGEIILIHTAVHPETDKPFLTEAVLKELNNADGRIVTAFAKAAMEHTGFQVTYSFESVRDAKKNLNETTGAES